MGRTGNRFAAKYKDMAPDDDVQANSRSINNEEDASELFMLEAEEAIRITQLTVTIDGSIWTDYHDDLWAMALRAYAPFSNNLQHLHIIVKGPVLFTQFNYVKPVISTMVPFGIPAGDSDSESTASDSANSSQTGVSSGRNKRTRAMHSPTTFRNPVTKYSKRFVPQEKVALHLTGQKAVITALLSLAKPIPRITIEGPMELAVRRNLITALNDGWGSSVHCQSQMGYSSSEYNTVEETEKHEQKVMNTGAEMVRLRSSDFADDDDDFDMTASTGPADWDVLTGRAGRQPYGWKTTTSAWKGPRGSGRRSLN